MLEGIEEMTAEEGRLDRMTPLMYTVIFLWEERMYYEKYVFV